MRARPRTPGPGGVWGSLRDALFVAALAAGLVVVLQTAAGAHAAFVSSRPQAGAELTSAPGVVEVEFTEPLIADLSSLSVTDPDGRTWEKTGVGERWMQAELATNSPGVYVVEWKTVSPIDGHTLRGAFRFGVGVAPGEAGAEATASAEPETPDVLLAVGRAVEYAGLLAVVGMLLVGWLARRDPPMAWVRVRVGQALGVALFAGVVVVLGEALLAAPAPSAAAVGRYLSAEPGVPRLARLAAEAAALATLRLRTRTVTATATVIAVAALAAGGHAAAAQPAWWGITVDALHLLAAGLWAGGILALATQRPPDGWGGEDAKRLLARFSPPAIGASLATVASGTLRGTQELVRLGDLLFTSYGQVLTLKMVTVALMVPLSLRAWRRRDARPRLEGTLAILAVAAAALLAAYPVPPQRAAEDVHAAEQAGPDPAIPRDGDLTLGADTGDVLVGLTLRPGRPGRNDVLVYLLPPSGGQAADELSAELVIGEDRVALEACGATCRRASVELDGDQTIAVRLAGLDDEPATFRLPGLPAPDGAAILDRVDARMAEVDSLRYEEVFGPVDPPLQTSVSMVRPDRIHVNIHTRERETIRIGDDRYQREGNQPWVVVTRDGAEVNVPTYIWDYQPQIAPRVVGSERIAGANTTIVSLFIDHTSGPIWYRLWVDDDGLVRRAEMRTQAHFMDHDYFDFGAPITIEPPV